MSLALVDGLRRSSSQIDPNVLRWARALVSPFVGPVRNVNRYAYEMSVPALLTYVPEISDVHRRTAAPARPNYHCAGFGFSFEEALMRGLGEAVERSSAMTFGAARPDLLERASEQELAERGLPFVPIADCARFSAEQYEQRQVPFPRPSATQPIAWLRMRSLADGGEVRVPAQAALNANPNGQPEPRFCLGVSTGTATHQDYERALLGALGEMIQVDALMGYWYAAKPVVRFLPSEQDTPRFCRLRRLHRRSLDRPDFDFEFYWFQQVDGLPLYIVACVMRREEGYPVAVVGVGSNSDLEAAMYSAMIESIPLSSLAAVTALERLQPRQDRANPPGEIKRVSRDALFAAMADDQYRNLDDNVGYYASSSEAVSVLDARFRRRDVVAVSDIRANVEAGRRSGDPLRDYLHGTSARHRLFVADLTTEDWLSVGLKVVKLRSPDMLTLCLPSMPEAAHPRFQAYGGFRSFAPHPYP